MTNFEIRCYCVVLSTDIPNNKKYILSTDPTEIVLPYVVLDTNIINNINQSLITKLKIMDISDNDLELVPQIITLHSAYIESENNQLNTVYGFLVNYHDQIKDSYWISFDYTEPNKYSNLISDVIQKL